MYMKKLPEFRNENEEFEFWSENDSTNYIDWSKAKKSNFPELKPTAKSISIRLTESMLNNLKQEANKMDIPYQSLMKMLISEGLDRRRGTHI